MGSRTQRIELARYALELCSQRGCIAVGGGGGSGGRGRGLLLLVLLDHARDPEDCSKRDGAGALRRRRLLLLHVRGCRGRSEDCQQVPVPLPVQHNSISPLCIGWGACLEEEVEVVVLVVVVVVVVLHAIVMVVPRKPPM